jgi:uncharacterized membrane protein (DUF485 family)
MAQHLRIARLFYLLLAIFTIGRLAMSHVPYEKGHHVFSLVTLTLFSAIFYGAFTRRWLGYRVLQAMALGALLALSAQIVVWAATTISYMMGANTYFTNPRALLGFNAPSDPIPFGRAMVTRAGGLVANTISGSIIAGLGWVMGGLLPSDTPKA